MATAKKVAAAARPKSTARGPARTLPAQGSRPGHVSAQPLARPAAVRTDAQRPPPADVDGAFQLLKAVLERHVHSLQVQFNTPENYTVVSRRLDPKGAPREFSVLLKLKAHVSFKFMPLAQFPELASTLPSELKARLQGRSAFSFTHPEPGLAGALDALVRSALARARSAGLA